MPTDPSDPRPEIPLQFQKPRRFPPDWLPDPVGANGSMGAPAGDERIWWRLQPGKVVDGVFVRRSVIHGGTCSLYPAGRHPEGWSFHTRPEVRRLLSRPDEVVACEKCRPEVGL